MPNIIPIRDLRDTNRLSEMCHSTNEPIFVTKKRLRRYGAHEHGHL